MILDFFKNKFKASYEDVRISFDSHCGRASQLIVFTCQKIEDVRIIDWFEMKLEVPTNIFVLNGVQVYSGVMGINVIMHLESGGD